MSSFTFILHVPDRIYGFCRVRTLHKSPSNKNRTWVEAVPQSWKLHISRGISRLYSKEQNFKSRADLNRRQFAQEFSICSPGLSASWRMQVEKNQWNHFCDRHLYQHCTCKRSLRTETKLSFRAFREERQFSGERANLPGIRLLLSSASKYWLDYFPRQIDLGCASVKM